MGATPPCAPTRPLWSPESTATHSATSLFRRALAATGRAPRRVCGRGRCTHREAQFPPAAGQVSPGHGERGRHAELPCPAGGRGPRPGRAALPPPATGGQQKPEAKREKCSGQAAAQLNWGKLKTKRTGYLLCQILREANDGLILFFSTQYFF